MSSLYQDTGRITEVDRVPKEFVVREYFEKDRCKRSGQRIYVYQGLRFFNWYVVADLVEYQDDTVFAGSTKRHFVAKTLSRDSTSAEVWNQARRSYTEDLCVVTMAEVCRLIEIQRWGQKGFLLTDYKNNIFFVRDAIGWVRIVHVRYSKKYGGWRIYAWMVEGYAGQVSTTRGTWGEHNKVNIEDWGPKDLENALGWKANRSQFIFRSR